MKLSLFLFLTMLVGTIAFAPLPKTRPSFLHVTAPGNSALGPLFSCSSGSVKDVVDNNSQALEQLKKLEEGINARAGEIKYDFKTLIDESQKEGRIFDARSIGSDSNIKAEYSSEFSLDKIANVIIAALKVAVASTDEKAPKPSMTPEAIAAYTDMVNAVAEAAKSGSDSSSSLTFSATRIGPGVFSYLYAVSSSIKDEETFGNEAVSCTAVFYEIFQSLDDIKNGTDFEMVEINAANLIKMKTIQAGLTESLANGDIDIETWIRQDEAYEKQISKLKMRLDKAGWGDSRFATFAVVQSLGANGEVISNALEAIKAKRNTLTDDNENTAAYDYVIGVLGIRIETSDY